MVNYLAEQGFDPKYGARPLQREIEKLIVAPMARLLMEQVGMADQSIHVDYDGERVKFVY
ncbi:MAG: hypothetical protein HC880_18690 [Bacteroidia bacterium]|nr:hypothetical protein [Bacteroidia bacterium]